MKLLLIEDDETLGKETANALQRESHRVDWVRYGVDGKVAAGSHEYDAILLDLGLPDMAGEQFLQQLRGLKNNTPVIVLTARDQMRDRVKSLDLGADDYLVKPVDLAELGARLRAVRRRASAIDDASNVQVYGPLELEQDSRVARWCGQEVTLTAKEFDVLEALLSRRPRVVSRQQLEDVLYGWGDEIDSNAIEVYVHFLRRKFTPGLIITVRGQGYQMGNEDALNAEVARNARPLP